MTGSPPPERPDGTHGSTGPVEEGGGAGAGAPYPDPGAYGPGTSGPGAYGTGHGATDTGRA
ncbi:hypothetical protein L1885_24125, partial [Streptomyces fuscigenes]|nr:hypothetical protein [Streptomyces fuscigenes]